MDNRVVVEAKSKINLSLAIVGRAADGRHLLDTVMAQTPLADTVEILKREDSQVNVKYTDGRSYEHDTARLTALAFVREYGACGADITITKRIPEGAGLGGSSADAAAVARGYKMLCAIEPTAEFLVSIGSDVPYLYTGGTCRVRGVGESVESVLTEKLHIALLYGELSVDTGKAYQTYDVIGGINGNIADFLAGGAPFNALEAASVCIEPSLKGLRRTLTSAGFNAVVMSGSGSAYLAMSRNEEEFQKYYEKAQILAKDKGYNILKFSV